MSTAEAAPVPVPDLTDPSLYFNRELSWLEFNARVLELAEDPGIPLLERLKFCAIYSSNLDEFFMVRVAGLHDQVEAGVETRLQDGRTPAETLVGIREAVRGQVERQSRVIARDILPALAERGIRIVTCDEIDDDARRRLDERFRRQIFPVLTPLAVTAGRPFPYISNLALSIGVFVRDPESGQETFARVKVPKEMLPRFVPIGDDVVMTLEHLIQANLEALFPGMEIVDSALFRVTRDADFTVSDEADDLLTAVEASIRRRRFGEVVRVEVERGMTRLMREQIVAALGAEEEDVVFIDGLLDAADFWGLYGLPGYGELRDPPWTPVTPPALRPPEGDKRGDVMAAMREGDVLLHHPYESFASSVERLVEQAVADDDVLAIKQTVYRTSDDTPLIPALIHAAERGKQAVCLVELKARFDEDANIQWARALEQSGVHVVYGLPALKTHAKCLLIVRREGDGVRHYVHIGTGNYHPKTARLYTDFGLLTCDDQLGADVADMFNQLTGFARPQRARRMLLAPEYLREGILDEIKRTVAAHQEGRPARIALKMNSLVDKRCIRALYRASQAGVRVDVNVRGICCLRPGVEGVSEHIRVCSVVGRFLEHSRIYAFERGDEQVVYIGSADLMPRNLDTRVELVAPVRDDGLRAELLDALERCLSDDTNAWELTADGSWRRRAPAEGTEGRNAHRELMALHLARSTQVEEDED